MEAEVAIYLDKKKIKKIKKIKIKKIKKKQICKRSELDAVAHS